MRRVPVIGSVYRPTIFSKIHIPGAGIDHRLNTNCHSGNEPGAVTPSSVIRDSGLLMHSLADSMTFQFPYHGESERFSIRLYRVSDITCPVTIHGLLNALVQRGLRHIEKLAGFRIYLPYREGISGVTVVSLVQSTTVH